MSLRETLFASPFVYADEDIDSTTTRGKRVLEQAPATKWEMWGYYLYYNGNNGFTLGSYMQNILQYLAYRGGFYPETPHITGCDTNDAKKVCYVSWANGSVPVASMAFYIQAIAFAVQFVLFTTFGSLADYGRWNTYILLLATVVGCITQIIPVAYINDDGHSWKSMAVIMVFALVSYGTSLVFYGAAFPTLSDNLPIVRKARSDPRLSRDEAANIAEKWRNHISAISTVWSNIGYLVMTVLLAGISFVAWQNYNFIPGQDHILGNVPSFNFISTAICGGYWLLNAIPYFISVPSNRRGPPLPDGSNHFTIGWKSVYNAVKEARKLPYLFIYIFAYFMFADAVSTMNQMISITQAQITDFSAQQITFFNLASSVASIIGCLFFLWLTKRYGVKTKTSLLTILLLTAIVPVWGCFGIGLTNFGIRTTWELWVFYIWNGLATAPIWAWQNTMLGELVPRGKENLFFGLFGIISKASTCIGPSVIGAITQYTDDVWRGWPFVLALFVVSIVIIWYIDVDKAKLDIADYLAEQDIIEGYSDGNELVVNDEKA